MNKIKFVCNAVRWFDKVNGNTYHSVRVTRVEDGATVYGQFQYGYGDQYRYTALKEMEKAGWLPEQWTGKHNNGFPKNACYERENDYPIIWNVTDGLKIDCIKNGIE